MVDLAGLTRWVGLAGLAQWVGLAGLAQQAPTHLRNPRTVGVWGVAPQV
ncbi:hypothetical protein JOD54_002968 [Actinokineospora baliensis]|nr:hypothetical protein [Actinokineospora baliensis]